MCMKKIEAIDIRTSFGRIKGKDIVGFLKTFSSIIKAVAARCLYGVYALLAVWRVTVALQEPVYWLLLFSICLIGIEAFHTIIARKGGELKWMTPSVFFYLVCAVPPIWLLELKLLHDRLQQDTSNSTAASSTASINSLINIDLSDQGWTLALEQILIFVLVFGKWIAPKGELTRDQLSQLLLVTLGAGADIIELLETFNEDEVQTNSEIVYLVLSVWSWSLLQFCIVPTSYKELPDVETPIDITTLQHANTSPTLSVTNENQNLKENKDVKQQDDLKEDLTTPKTTESNNNEIKQEEKVPKAMAKKEPTKKQIKRSQSEGVAKFMQNGSTKGRGLVKGSSVGSSLNKRGSSVGKNKVGIITQPDQQKESIETPPHVNGLSEGPEVNGKEKPHTECDMKATEHTCGKVGFANEEKQQDKDDIKEESQQNDDNDDPWDHAIIVIHDQEDDLKLEDSITGWLTGSRCCVCFCCYTEIWGMVMSMLFQDVPFLITRLFIMFHYNVISHMTVFFTFKNVVIILLLLNRIRVVVLEERANWKKHMDEVIIVQKRNEEILREHRRMHPDEERTLDSDRNTNTIIDVDSNSIHEEGEKIQNNPPKRRRKPKWLFWRV